MGLDQSNSLAVHNWQTNTLLVSASVDRFRVADAAWLDETKFVVILKIINSNNVIIKDLWAKAPHLLGGARQESDPEQGL